MKRIILTIFLSLTFVSFSKKKINLVWQMNRSSSWEADWIDELLSDFEVNHIEDCKYEKLIDNSIIVVTYWEDFSSYIQKLYEKNYKYGVILLGDEFYKAPTDFYDKVQFVFRNYWHKNQIHHKNVYTFPLGYKKGFWQNCSRQLKDIYHRDYVWSFAGQIVNKPTREHMVKVMKQIPNNYIHEIYAWGDISSLSVDAYQNLLLNSIFVPCPTGWWNLDSFRIYEALECGCIPVVEKIPFDYFNLYLGSNPFITISSWNEVIDIINNLLSDPIALEKRRLACQKWWLTYKDNLKQTMSTVIKEKIK